MPARVLDLRGRGVRRRTCARPPTGSRCSATSAAPATRTKSRRVFGDEIAIRAQTLVHDAANPAEVMRDVIAFATAGRTDGGARRDRPDAPADRARVGGPQLHVGVRSGRHARRSGSTSAPACARRCAFTFERWNGNGYPDPCEGEAIPLPMRVVHLSHDMEAIGRLFSPDQRARGRARSPRPHVRPGARRPVRRARARRGSTARARSSRGTPCSPSSPSRTACSTGDALDDALTVAADFIDLKSPYMGGHSRRCAQLAADAARVLGFAEEAITALRRAALVHDFGTTAVPNSIWDKPGPLTRAEFDRVELHPMLTEQMLRRSPALAALNPVASRAPREVRRLRLPQARARRRRRPGACVLAATEIYVGLTTERADRPAFSRRGRRRRASPARGRGRARAARDPRRAGRRGTRRAGRRARAGGRTTRAGSPGARSTSCASPRAGSRRARSPTGSSSHRRPPTTTSSTSTTRSASRPAPPPRCGRCSTTSSAERGSAIRPDPRSPHAAVATIAS